MALDTEQTKNSLFGNIKKQSLKSVSVEELPVAPIQNRIEKVQPIAVKEPQREEKSDAEPQEDTILAKWQTLDRVTVLLSEEEKEGLDKLSKKIMKYRAKDTRGKKEKERITANTIIRALIDNLLECEDKLEMTVLETEEDVRAWIKNELIRS